MLHQGLVNAYDRFLALMDEAEDVIDRKDLSEMRILEKQVERLIMEMQALFYSVTTDPAFRECAAMLELPIREALEKVTLNQIRLTRWLNQMGARLGRLQQG